MHVHESLDERQADTQTALSAIEAAVDLREHVEHERQHLGRDAQPVVDDAQLGSVRSGRERYLDASPARRVLAGVVQQIADHLFDARRIGIHPYRVCGQVCDETVLGGLNQGLRALDCGFDHHAQIDTFDLEYDLAGRDARDLEQIVDQLNELHDLALHHSLNACTMSAVEG